jgi:hypothetical protein
LSIPPIAQSSIYHTPMQDHGAAYREVHHRV